MSSFPQSTLFGASTPSWGGTSQSNNNKQSSRQGESSTPSSTTFGTQAGAPVETPPTSLNTSNNARTTQFSFGGMSVSTPNAANGNGTPGGIPGAASTGNGVTASGFGSSNNGGRTLFGVTPTNNEPHTSTFSFTNSSPATGGPSSSGLSSSTPTSMSTSRAPPQSHIPGLIVDDYNNAPTTFGQRNNTSSHLTEPKGFGLRQRRGSSVSIDTTSSTIQSLSSQTTHKSQTMASQMGRSNTMMNGMGMNHGKKPPMIPPPKTSRLGMSSLDPSLMDFSSSPISSERKHDPVNSAERHRGGQGLFGSALQRDIVLKDTTNTSTKSQSTSIFPSDKPQVVTQTPKSTSAILTTSRSKPNTTSTAAKTDYSKWVVVYGFSNSKQYQTIMTRFESIGSIEQQYPSKYHGKIVVECKNGKKMEPAMNNNWVCIEYQSNLQADKALCQHGSLMDVSGSASSSRNQLPHKMQEHALKDVVVVGVMRADLQIANTLGLRHYLEFGSCVGAERTSFLSTTEDEEDEKNDSTKNQKHMNLVGASTSVMNEDDILLNASDHEMKDGMPQYLSTRVGQGGLMEMILGWMFQW